MDKLMSTSFTDRLQAVNQTTLMPLVRQALLDETAEIVDWDCQPLVGGWAARHGGSYGLYRFCGQAHSRKQVCRWSLILKATAVALTAANQTVDADPAQANYWKREVLIYQSGWLDNLPEGLVAPRCFGVVEYPDQEFWIWLEDVDDSVWSLETYRPAAFDLGQFSGAYLNGWPLPQADWLSTGRTRLWLERGEAGLADIQSLSRQSLNQRWLLPEVVTRITALWAERERLLAARDRLPRTFCHHDTGRQNMMRRQNKREQTETVAIDWAFVGTGAVGEDLAPLIAGNVAFNRVEATQLNELEANVWEGYMAGLRQAGWEGDHRLVRFGYTATAALAYGLGQAGLFAIAMTNPERIQSMEQFSGRAIEHILAQRAIFQRYCLDIGEEALALLAEL
jgi:hypothetical protein